MPPVKGSMAVRSYQVTGLALFRKIEITAEYLPGQLVASLNQRVNRKIRP